MPQDIEKFWEWQCSTIGISSLWGRYHWVLQTYLQLQRIGLACQIVSDFPNQGMVFAHRDDLNESHKPTKNLFIVCLLVDRTALHPYANHHIVHNPAAKIRFKTPSTYIPPWPQIELQKRSTQRGSSFETIGFFGDLENMADNNQIEKFSHMLSKHGLNLVIPSRENWNKFSNIDVIYGVRKFGKEYDFLEKPALKLFNAWLAEVPAVLGYESAYRTVGQPGINYLEATTSSEVEEKLVLLKNNVQLRESIVKAGRDAATRITTDSISDKWRSLIKNELLPRFYEWRNSKIKRQRHYLTAKMKEISAAKLGSLTY